MRHEPVAPWRSGYHYCKTSFIKARTQALRRFKPCSWRVGDSRWWRSLTMVPIGNKAAPFVGQPYHKNNSLSSSSSISFSCSPIFHLILKLPNIPPHSHAPQYSTSFSCCLMFHLILMLPKIFYLILMLPKIFHLILKLPNLPSQSHAPQYYTSFSCSPIFHLILMLPNVLPHSRAPQCSTSFSRSALLCYRIADAI